MDFSQRFKNLHNLPLKQQLHDPKDPESGKLIWEVQTLRTVSMRALMTDEEISKEEKNRRWKLFVQIRDSEDKALDLSEADLETLRDCINLEYKTTLVVGQALEMLEKAK